MSSKSISNLPASVRARLLNQARDRKEDFNMVLLRYALERLMYRLSASKHSDKFILKGAMLFEVWGGIQYRSTRDMDLLGFGDFSQERLKQVFQDVCKTKVKPDGVDFAPESVRVEEISGIQEYSGQRVLMEASLAGARIRRIQVDVGFGDAVVPKARHIEYPTMLDFPAPRLLAYSPETVVAEKFQAIISLGMVNTRMKDFFDLHHISHIFAFKGSSLSKAIQATFERRKTEVPSGIPIAFKSDFYDSPDKQSQWSAFVSRNELLLEEIPLRAVMKQISTFLLPPAYAIFKKEKFTAQWPKCGPWKYST